MHNNMRLLQTRLNRILAPKNLTQLLKRPSPCLNIKLPDKQELENVPENEEEIVLPARTGKRDACNESVVESGDVDPEIVECHAFRSRLVAEAFYGVELL